MNQTENDVAAHYTTGDLLGRIRAAVAEMGADPDAPSPEDLKPVDEFHTGGLLATEALLSQLDITPETRVLDIGCGLGGTARHIAHNHKAPVKGIDLTPDYVDVAIELSRLCGLDGVTEFEVASGTDLPFGDAGFDLVTMFHVGMNIADKAALMAEAARVLAPGGRFALFDVMAEAVPPDLTFPFPWAEHAHFSFVAPPDDYLAAAQAAGLAPVTTRGRRDFTLEFFENVFASIAKNGPSPLGIHLLMRDTAAQKLQNYVACVKASQIAPYEMIFAKETA